MRLFSTRVANGLALVSGFAALQYEVLWARQLSELLGGSVTAGAWTVAWFFVGLSLGAWRLGPGADRTARPWRRFAVIEAGIVVVVLPTLWLDELAGLVLPLLGEALWGPAGGAIKAALAGLVVLPPAVLMGGTLPALGAAAITAPASAGAQRAWLYGLNTLGGAAGIAFISFVSLPELGIQRSYLIAMGCGLFVTVTAWACGRRDRARARMHDPLVHGCHGQAEPRNEAELARAVTGKAHGQTSLPMAPLMESHLSQQQSSCTPRAQPTGQLAAGAAGTVDAESTCPPYAALLLSAVSGYGVLAAEVLVLIAFSQVYTSATFCFATMVFVVVLMLGAAALGLPLLSRLTGGHVPLLAIVLPLAGLTLAGFPMVFLYATDGLEQAVAATGATRARYGLDMLVMAVITTGPVFGLMGLVLPAVFGLDAAGSAPGSTGWSRLLAANAAGAMLGAWSAGAVLMPVVGLWGGFVGLGLLYAIVGIGVRHFPIFGLHRDGWPISLEVGDANSTSEFASPTAEAMGHPTREVSGDAKQVVAARRRGVRPTRRVRVAGGVISVGVAVAAGVVIVRDLPVLSLVEDERIIDIRQGREGVAGVVDQGWLTLRLNNYYWLGAANDAAARHQRRMGILPLLLHPAPRHVAHVGLGMGITAGAPLADEDLESLTALELSPLVAELSRKHMAPYASGLFDDPRARVVVEDGRTFLRARPDRFDVITGDLFTPWRRGVGSAYTLEHFRAVRAALRPGGLFCQWLPAYQLDAATLRVIVATFVKAFPGALLLHGSLDPDAPTLAMIGFRGRPVRYSVIRDRCALFRERGWADDTFLREPLAVVMLMVGRADRLIEADTPINTIDNGWVEFRAPVINIADDAIFLRDEPFRATVGFLQSTPITRSDLNQTWLRGAPSGTHRALLAGIHLYDLRAALLDDQADRAELESLERALNRVLPPVVAADAYWPGP